MLLWKVIILLNDLKIMIMNVLNENFQELTLNEMESISAGSEFSEAVFQLLGVIAGGIRKFVTDNDPRAVEALMLCV